MQPILPTTNSGYSTKDLREPKEEGVDKSNEETFDIDLSDVELESLAKKWKLKYDSYYGPIKERAKKNITYLRGQQLKTFFGQWSKGIPLEEQPPLYNLLYECMEILAPMVTKNMPQASVTFNDENTPECKEIAKHIEQIVKNANLPAKLESALRDRFTNFIGILKIYYDVNKKQICIEKINPEDIIIDPMSSVIDGISDGEYIGQLVTITNREAKLKFPNFRDLIGEDKTKKFTYIEWWTHNYVFQTCKGILLDKFKNPYWNYDRKETTISTDAYGNQIPKEQTVKGENHTYCPIRPYIFININNDGTQPHDITTELEQAVPVQHSYDQMLFQINKNAARTNGYVVTSGFNKDTAKSIAEAAWNGGIIMKPSKIAEFEMKTGVGLPSFIFDHKNSLEVAIRNLFGVRGSSAQGILGEQTVRGKILMQGQDGERTNTVTRRLELACTNVFNYILQILYVTESIPLVGFEVKAKEGSMIPKDTMTQRNEAIDLWAAGALTPEQLYQRIDIINPIEEAQKLMVYRLAPNMMLPQEVQQAMQPQPEPPKVSTNFKDITQNEQDQVLTKMGIQPDPNEERPDPNASPQKGTDPIKSVNINQK
jgi:hypothetical protein